MSRDPDPRAMGLSTIDYCKLLPRRRYSHEARGRVLLMPQTGLVVVPYEEFRGGGWYVTVVDGHGSYPVGGYNLSVSADEIETAVELALGDPVPAIVVNSHEEAGALEDGTYILTRAHGGLRKTTVDGETRWMRSILKKVSLRTDELPDEFPIGVSASSSTKAAANV